MCRRDSSPSPDIRAVLERVRRTAESMVRTFDAMKPDGPPEALADSPVDPRYFRMLCSLRRDVRGLRSAGVPVEVVIGALRDGPDPEC